MNTIKLHKGGEVRRVRISQTDSYSFYRSGQVRNVPYLSEVLAWAKKNGWMRLRKKP